MLHGLYWLVANVADEAPVLFVVDDAQWADEPSLRFLAYLGRRIYSLPVALLIAARTPDDGPAVTATALQEIRASAGARRLEPQALDERAVQGLLSNFTEGTVEATFATACREATGGNPFLVGELARSLRDAGVPLMAIVTREGVVGDLRSSDPNALLTAGEVARMLGVTAAWVYAQSRSGTIPTVTLGRYRRYRRAAIKSWVRGLEDRSAGNGRGVAPTT